jgi:IS5 family transposase
VTLSRAVPSSSAIFSFDLHLLIKLARHDEIRPLVKAGNMLRTLGLAKANGGAAQHAFEHIAHKLAHAIHMTRKGPAEEALVEQRRIRHAENRERLNARKPVTGICLPDCRDPSV